MMPLRFALKITSLSVLALMLAGTATVRAEPAGDGGARDAYFSYPLRAGESVNDVARIFRVPVEELIELNQIRDATRLQLGQIIRVPDGFAREAAELRAERERLIAEKQHAERDSQDRQRAAAAVEAQLHQVEAERNSLTRELSMMAGWQRTAMLALGLFFAALAWAVKSRIDRLKLMRKHHVVVTENAALAVAKDKYRQAAGQVELRYQNLYAKKGGPPALAISEGVERIRQAFAEGSKEIEALLATLRTEGETQLQILDAEDKGRTGILHPLRELLERSGFKYHTP
jgi:murein DD-endopeptidase MepM/ murein hydrolase activator NlpD